MAVDPTTDLLGVMAAYNEEDVIAGAVTYLAEAGHDVHVFDHGSTDSTAALAAAAGATVHPLPKDLPFILIWPAISNWIATQPHTWVTWCAPDEFLRLPDGSAPSPETWTEVHSRGDVIYPRVREFWPTTADDPTIPDHVARIRHFRWREDLFDKAPRHWKRTLVRVLPNGLHLLKSHPKWQRDRIVDDWILDHYPVRSQSQGIAKIAARHWHPWYGRARRGDSLLEDPSTLECLT